MAKKATGLLIALLGILFIVLLILRFWNINIISWGDMLRSGVTLFLIAIAIALFLLVRILFFRKSV